MIGRPFQRGASGNPGGRPKVRGEFQELAREHTIEALDVLVQIMLAGGARETTGCQYDGSKDGSRRTGGEYRRRRSCLCL